MEAFVQLKPWSDKNFQTFWSDQQLSDRGFLSSGRTDLTLVVRIVEVLELPKMRGYIKKFEIVMEKLRKQSADTVPSEEQKLPKSTKIKQMKAKRQSTIVFSSGRKLARDRQRKVSLNTSGLSFLFTERSRV